MGIWTVDKEITLKYIYSPNRSGPGVYAGLLIVARQDLDERGVVVELTDSNPAAALWLKDIEAGFEEFRAEREAEGQPLGALRLEVTKISWHETDTHDWVMRRVACSILREVFNKCGGGLELLTD